MPNPAEFLGMSFDWWFGFGSGVILTWLVWEIAQKIYSRK